MGKQLRGWLIVFVFIFFALGLSACSKEEGQSGIGGEGIQTEDPTPPTVVVEEVKTPTEGGILRVGMLQLPAWDPFKWESASPQYSAAERLVFRGLFTYSDDQKLVPDLINDYSIEDLGDGKSVLQFTLKDDAVWHDGTPVTFADVVFTLQTYLDPFYYGAWKQNLSSIDGTSAFRSGKATSIAGIQQSDDGLITIALTDAKSSFYHALIAPVLPAHVLHDLDIEQIRAQLVEGKVVGNGAFQFGERSDKELQLKRALAFAEGGTYLDGITFVVNDSTFAITAMEQAYDVVQVPPMKALDGNDVKTVDSAQNVFYYIGFNVADDVTKQKEIRVAIAEALNRSVLIQNELLSQGTAIDSIIPPQSWLAEGTTAATDSNVSKAQQRMTGLGYSATKPLTLSLHYAGENALMESIVERIRTQLAEVYISLEKKELSADDYYAYIFSGKPVQAFIHAWPFAKDYGYWWKLYGSYHDVKDLGLNVLRYSDKNADMLLKQLYDTPPSVTQKETARSFAQQFQADQVIVPLFSPVQRYWVNNKAHIEGFNGDGWLIEIDKWWVEK